MEVTGATGLAGVVDEGDKFHFFLSIMPLESCRPENMAQIMLALMRVAFMDLDVKFLEIKEEDPENYNGRQRELNGKYGYAGHGCRRCRQQRGRKLVANELYDENYDTQNAEEDDPLAIDIIAFRMNRALEVAILDTFALDPNNCLVGMSFKNIFVDIALD